MEILAHFGKGLTFIYATIWRDKLFKKGSGMESGYKGSYLADFYSHNLANKCHCHVEMTPGVEGAQLQYPLEGVDDERIDYLYCKVVGGQPRVG